MKARFQKYYFLREWVSTTSNNQFSRIMNEILQYSNIIQVAKNRKIVFLVALGSTSNLGNTVEFSKISKLCSHLGNFQVSTDHFV